MDVAPARWSIPQPDSAEEWALFFFVIVLLFWIFVSGLWDAGKYVAKKMPATVVFFLIVLLIVAGTQRHWGGDSNAKVKVLPDSGEHHPGDHQPSHHDSLSGSTAESNDGHSSTTR